MDSTKVEVIEEVTDDAGLHNVVENAADKVEPRKVIKRIIDSIDSHSETSSSDLSEPSKKKRVSPDYETPVYTSSIYDRIKQRTSEAEKKVEKPARRARRKRRASKADPNTLGVTIPNLLMSSATLKLKSELPDTIGEFFIGEVLRNPEKFIQVVTEEENESEEELENYELDVEAVTIRCEEEKLSDEELKQRLLKMPFALIKGLTKDLKLELFDSENISKICGEDQLELRIQNTQLDDSSNVHLRRKTWFYSSKPGSSTVKDQIQHQKDLIEPTEGEKTYFGTNLDMIDRQKYGVFIEEMEKLPPVLRPSDPGDMLAQLPFDLPGINRVQVYLKVHGSRTPAHQENLWLTSVNINAGPGLCIWYFIGVKYTDRFNELAKKQGVSLTKGSCWPIVTDLVEHKIPYWRIVQKPGDIIFVGYGTIHWVQAQRSCNNIAWNAAPFTAEQLKAARLATLQYKRDLYRSLVPLEMLSWSVAQSIVSSYERSVPSVLLESSTDPKKALRLILEECILSCNRQAMTATFVEDQGKRILLSKLEVDHKKPTVFCTKCSIETFNIIFIRRNKALCLSCSVAKDPTFENTDVHVQEALGNCYGKLLQKLVKIYNDLSSRSTSPSRKSSTVS